MRRHIFGLRLQSISLALTIVECHYARAVAGRVAGLIKREVMREIALQIIVDDGFEHYLSIRD